MDIWTVMDMILTIIWITDVRCEQHELTTVRNPCHPDVEKLCADGSCVSTLMGCAGESPPEWTNSDNSDVDRDLSSRTSLYYITIPLGVIIVVSSIACRAFNRTAGGQRRYHSWRQSFRESVGRRRNGPANDVNYITGDGDPRCDDQTGGYSSMEACYPPPVATMFSPASVYPTEPPPRPRSVSPVPSGVLYTQDRKKLYVGNKERSPSFCSLSNEYIQQHQQAQYHTRPVTVQPSSVYCPQYDANNYK